MARFLYVWSGFNVSAVDTQTGAVVRQSPLADTADDAWGCVLADGRVLISADARIVEGDDTGVGPGYAILDPGLAHWTDGPPVKLGPLRSNTNWNINTILAVANKVVGFARAGTAPFGEWDYIVQFRSLNDLTPVHVEQLLYDTSDLEGDESSPEAPAVGPDSVYYTTEGGYTHAVNVNTWAQTRPINILTDPTHYSEDEHPNGLAGAIDTDLQGSAYDASTGRVWSYAYNEQAGDTDVWNAEQIQIFSGVGDNSWRLEWSGTPGTLEETRGWRGFSGTGVIIPPYYYMCPEGVEVIARFHMDTQVMEWSWTSLAPIRGSSYSLLTGGSGAGFNGPIPGVHLATGVRLDPINEPRGSRLAVR